MLNNKKIILIVLAVIIMLSIVGCSGKQEEESVAVVNGEQLLKEDFDTALNQYKGTYEQQGVDLSTDEGKEVLKELKQQILDNMIGQELLRQQAEQEGYEVTDEEVNNQLDLIKGQFQDDKQFKEALEANDMTESELKELVIKDQKVEQYLDAEIGEITVTEDKIKELYDFYSEQNSEMPSLEEVKDQLEQLAKSEMQQQETNKIIERLKVDSDIEILYVVS